MSKRDILETFEGWDILPFEDGFIARRSGAYVALVGTNWVFSIQAEMGEESVDIRAEVFRALMRLKELQEAKR